MKQPGDKVKLRVAFGQVPDAGTVLRMPSGRRYWVWTVTGKTLHCRVMAPGEPIPNIARAVLDWTWAPRTRRRLGHGKPLAQLIWEAVGA
jgi:hypothetical protein